MHIEQMDPSVWFGLMDERPKIAGYRVSLFRVDLAIAENIQTGKEYFISMQPGKVVLYPRIRNGWTHYIDLEHPIEFPIGR